MNDSHLSIELDSKFARFVHFQGEGIMNSVSVELNEFSGEQSKEKIRSIFEQHSFLNGTFENISLGWTGKKVTLVPNDIFTESSAEEIIRLCYGSDIPKDEIDFNRIYECGIVNIYQIPMWVKSLFVVKFPMISIQHALSHTIRLAMKKGFDLKVILLMQSDYVQMLIIKHNELIYSGGFDYQNSDDILYQLTFVLQQKELQEQKGTLEIGSSAGVDEELIQKLKNDFRRVKELKNLDLIEIEFHNAKAQQLCV